MRQGALGTLFFLAVMCAEVAALNANPLRQLKTGDPAPGFSLKDEHGAPRSLSDYGGKPVVLCYFRPGQSFSDKALAALAKLQGRFSPHGVAFLALYHPDPEEPAKPKPVPFPTLIDADRQVYSTLGLFIMPTTVVLDKEHRVRLALGSYEDGIADDIASALDAALGIKEEPKPAARASAGPSEVPEVGLARRLLSDRRPQEALDALGPALQAAQAGCAARLAAGEAMVMLGRFADAKPQAEACLKLEPASPAAALVLGRALLAGSDYPAAETWLKKAALGPSPQQARYALGQLYEKTGRKDEALAEYRAALERALGR